MTDLDALIEALEKAPGANFAIEAAIARAARPNDPSLPPFMTSVDAALKLVPEGAWWEIVQRQAPDSPMRHFGAPGLFRASVGNSYGDDGCRAFHDSPAIALCIAALRARAALARSREGCP